MSPDAHKLESLDTNRPAVDILKDSTKPKQSSLHSLSEDDIANIWSYISDYIIKQLRQKKGVHINGLGTFTFSHKSVTTGKKTSRAINRPVFIVSEKFVMQHNLPSQKQYQTGDIPVVPLNFAAIAFESPYPRDTVETCAREVLTWLSRSVAENGNIEFVFSSLGRLTIRDKKVKMRFFKEFVGSLDDSRDVLQTMIDRPFTPDSVMTERPLTSRPGTATLILPSVAITRQIKEPKLPAITEDFEQTPRVEQQQSGDSAKESLETSKMDLDDNITFQHEQIKAELPLPPVHDTPKLASAASKPPSGVGLKRSNTSPNLMGLTNSKNTTARSEKMPPQSAASSGCGHRASADLDICYLCHQREVRNQAVDFSKERQRRLEEEDKLLAQYQHLRDTEAILKEQEKLTDTKNLQKSISAFNLGVADAVKEERSKRVEYHPSFLLQTRPYTPHKYFGQASYYEELNNQVGTKQEKERKLKQDKEFLEKLEQIQLAEDLAAQREAYLKEKHDQKNALQKALETQLKYLPEQLPKAVPDSDKPIFGLHDATSDEKLKERVVREKELKEDLLRAAREKKKEAVLGDLLNQKEEEEMLADARNELREECLNRQNRKFNQRRNLEADWLRSMHVKQQREEDDNRHRLEAGSLLLDQAHVSRCGQCQRKLRNKGATNLWKESFYVPGSRLIL